MFHKRVLWWLILIPVALAVFVIYVLWDGDGLPAYRKIQMGMTLEEVQSRIGKPVVMSQRKAQQFALLRPGSLSEPIPEDDAFEGDRWSTNRDSKDWHFDSGVIRVGFGMDGRIVWKRFFRRQPSMLRRLQGMAQF